MEKFALLYNWAASHRLRRTYFVSECDEMAQFEIHYTNVGLGGFCYGGICLSGLEVATCCDLAGKMRRSTHKMWYLTRGVPSGIQAGVDRSAMKM